MRNKSSQNEHTDTHIQTMYMLYRHIHAHIDYTHALYTHTQCINCGRFNDLLSLVETYMSVINDNLLIIILKANYAIFII